MKGGEMHEIARQISAPSPIQIDELSRALETATDPAEIKDINARLDAFESYMHDSGLYSIEDMRPVNQLRMRARWKLGGALKAIEREGRGRPSSKNTNRLSIFWKWTKETLGLEPPTVVAAERIGTMPESELVKAFVEAEEQARLTFYNELIDRARPYWYKANREAKHLSIAASAKALSGDRLGPFPLIYADPPTRFEVYSEKGLERTPDQHYPTLSWEEIENFKVGGLPIREIAHRDAALLMFCTSSNLPMALKVMAAWDFEFKSSAVWVKASQPDDDEVLTRFGLGLVFRNMHEILLYGTRGNMPGPQYQPPSVFFYRKGRHSAKPPQIRTEIEKMYPDFDEESRLELFAREPHDGWTVDGYESGAE